jgi:hypothetical protein
MLIKRFYCTYLLGERLSHKLWQSLQEMATTRYGLRITVLCVEREGNFL